MSQHLFASRIMNARVLLRTEPFVVRVVWDICREISFPLLETAGGCSAAPDATIYGSGNPQMQLQLPQEIFII